jgi:hypothetical protein
LLLGGWGIYWAVSGLSRLGVSRHIVTGIVSHPKEPFDGPGDLQYISATFNGCQTSATAVNTMVIISPATA